MPLTDNQIHFAVRDRLCERWPKKMIDEHAAPVAAIGIIQKQGERFGSPVVCTCEGLADEDLGELLIGIGKSLIMQTRKGHS